MLTLFFERPDVFTDEVIVDEIIDFFGAASETTQKSVQTMMFHFVKSKEDLQRVRDEFNAVT